MADDTHIETRWLVQGRLILVTAPPTLTLDALRENDELVHMMLDSSDAPLVHVLLDARVVTTYPPLRDAREMKTLTHPRLGWSVTVGVFQDPILRFFMGAVRSIGRLRQRDFRTMPEALVFLKGIDPALAEEKIIVVE